MAFEIDLDIKAVSGNSITPEEKRTFFPFKK